MNHSATRRYAAALLTPFLCTLVACEAQKSENPLSPAIAGPIAGVEVTPPRLLEPGQGFKFKESQQPIKLLIENASTTGVRTLYYVFEVASDQNFETKVFARTGVPAGDGGRTSVMVDRLQEGRAYYWRARADDGANASVYSTASFEVLPRPVLQAPGLVSPINNERVTTSRPILIVSAPDRNVAVGSITYEFQVARDQGFGNIVASGLKQEDGVTTGFTPENALTANVQHFWRARATDGETTSGWSATGAFLTPAPAPTPSPSPNPAPVPGGSCALGNGPAIVACISARYPDKIAPVGSLGERQANMMFLRDRIIEAGKCSGLEYGWNLKRGGPELSIDVIAWQRPDGNMGVDIAFDYDNHSQPLRLTWAEIDLFAKIQHYGPVNCGGV